jgi:hypothetical protein
MKRRLNGANQVEYNEMKKRNRDISTSSRMIKPARFEVKHYDFPLDLCDYICTFIDLEPFLNQYKKQTKSVMAYMFALPRTFGESLSIYFVKAINWQLGCDQYELLKERMRAGYGIELSLIRSIRSKYFCDRMREVIVREMESQYEEDSDDINRGSVVCMDCVIHCILLGISQEFINSHVSTELGVNLSIWSQFNYSNQSLLLTKKKNMVINSIRSRYPIDVITNYDKSNVICPYYNGTSFQFRSLVDANKAMYFVDNIDMSQHRHIRTFTVKTKRWMVIKNITLA